MTKKWKSIVLLLVAVLTMGLLGACRGGGVEEGGTTDERRLGR